MAPLNKSSEHESFPKGVLKIKQNLLLATLKMRLLCMLHRGNMVFQRKIRAII